MTYDIYQVDAFADRVFEGNPAALVPMEDYPADRVLLQIAQENNLSETAYIINQGRGSYKIRWFTPGGEVALCGHATLAAAYVIWHELGDSHKELVLDSPSGPLSARRLADEAILIGLPADHPTKIDRDHPIATYLGCDIVELWRGRDDLIAVVDGEATVRSVTPNYRQIAELDARGVIITSRGASTDIVCRSFYPAYGIDEDPVTGSAHSVLTPLWTKTLRTNVFTSEQVGPRGGKVECIYRGSSVALIGQAALYMRGQIYVP